MNDDILLPHWPLKQPPLLSCPGVALFAVNLPPSRFLIPAGMALGASVTWPQFLLANLLPVTLGNIVGGAVAVCGLYSGAFGSLFGKKKTA